MACFAEHGTLHETLRYHRRMKTTWRARGSEPLVTSVFLLAMTSPRSRSRALRAFSSSPPEDVARARRLPEAPARSGLHTARLGPGARLLRDARTQSPRVMLEAVAKTAEGRDLVLAAISSEANLADIAALEGLQRAARRPAPRVARPAHARRSTRGAPSSSSRTRCTRPSAAAPQFAMQLAYTLATSDEEPWRSAREQSSS